MVCYVGNCVVKINVSVFNDVIFREKKHDFVDDVTTHTHTKRERGKPISKNAIFRFKGFQNMSIHQNLSD